MSIVLSITIRNIKQTLRTPGQVVMTLVFPIALILMFAFIFSGSDIASEQETFSIGIIN